MTGCLDVSKSSLDPSDSGGQFDVRFPNGAQCTFGGYGASFIQLYVPLSSFMLLQGLDLHSHSTLPPAPHFPHHIIVCAFSDEFHLVMDTHRLALLSLYVM